MPIIKCKMCGGDLNIVEGSTVAECAYCGTKQTVPSADNEKKLTLFARAGRLLRACEFDKAAGVFESIVADFPEEAEAYWGLVLCKYGIEYVDDPATGKKIPTCHRSSFDSVLDDPNFEQACENTDAVARRVYRDEARQIEDLRQAILQVSGKEEPYDVFISYKETDENGDRTLDSVIAQDIYKELTGEGYRVFFSRISLEDKLGTEYEPYIFAALNSAKVMLVVGTDYEYFDSVWVKNEWSRFLKLIAAGQKKTLIPVFKNMDAYDMPKEFKKLAAQDMGKVGAMQDLLRGVEKLVGKKKEIVKETVKETVVVQQGGGANVTALLKRGQQALEDGEWDKAKEFFNRVLDADAENAEAFFGLFLAGTKCRDEGEYIERVCAYSGDEQQLTIPEAKERIEAAVKANALKDYLGEDELRKLFRYDLRYSTYTRENRQACAGQQMQLLESDRNYTRARRYAKGETAARLDKFAADLRTGLDTAVADAARQEKAAGETKQKAYEAFLAEAEKKAKEQRRQAEEKREVDFQAAKQRFEKARDRFDYQNAKNAFLKLAPYKNSEEMASRCTEEVERIEKARAEEQERQRVQRDKNEKEKKAKQKKLGIVACTVAVATLAMFLIVTKVIVPGNQYKAAEALFEAGQVDAAAEAFEALGEYKDSTERVMEAKCAKAERRGNIIYAVDAYSLLRTMDGKVFCTGENSARQKIDISGWQNVAKVTGTGGCVLGLTFDGKILTNDIGDIELAALSDTSQFVDIDTCNSHSLGLRSDGTVVATGKNNYGQCNVSGWRDIVAISAGFKRSLGLRSDGTVVAAGDNTSGVSSWTDIVAINAENGVFWGLKSDGTVVHTPYDGDYNYGEYDVSGWRDIVAIEIGSQNTVGLKADGTVVVVGRNNYNQLDAAKWTDIVKVCVQNVFIVGLKADGTVVAVGNNEDGQCNVSEWTDVVDIAVGSWHTLGLKADGTVVATGSNKHGQLNVSDWQYGKQPNIR